jgi:predicted phosphodiesterase
MILLLTDVHCRYHLVNEQIAFAEKEHGETVTSVLVLGDFGLFAHTLQEFFRRRQQRFLRPVFIIEGNHEDFRVFSELVQEYQQEFTYLPRGSVRTIDGIRFLALGGAAYMDAMTTPPGAEIRESDLQACLAHPPGSVDIVLSHDCPQEIGVKNAPGFEHYAPPGFPGGIAIAAYLKPRLWFFGHHHRWFGAELPPTRYHGLPESWNGFILLRDNFQVSLVPHEIPLPASLWSQAWQAVKKWFSY